MWDWTMRDSGCEQEISLFAVEKISTATGLVEQFDAGYGMPDAKASWPATQVCMTLVSRMAEGRSL